MGQDLSVAAIAPPQCDPGLAAAFEQVQDRGVPGYEIDFIDFPAPIGGYQLLHIWGPSAGTLEALLIGRALGLPVLAGFHAPLDFGAASLDPLYAQADLVLSPSSAADEQLERLGVAGHALARWQSGVDPRRFHPARYAPELLPNGARSGLAVLYTGALGPGHGLELLAQAFLIARDHDPRLALLLAGPGRADAELLHALGDGVTVIEDPDEDARAALYASCELFVFPDAGDPFGHSIVEAQASGLPVLAVDAGAGRELIENGRNGCLVAPEPQPLAAAIRGLARRATLRERLATGGLLAAAERSWERSLAQLAGAYALATARGLHANVRAA